MKKIFLLLALLLATILMSAQEKEYDDLYYQPSKTIKHKKYRDETKTLVDSLKNENPEIVVNYIDDPFQYLDRINRFYHNGFDYWRYGNYQFNSYIYSYNYLYPYNNFWFMDYNDWYWESRFMEYPYWNYPFRRYAFFGNHNWYNRQYYNYGYGNYGYNNYNYNGKNNFTHQVSPRIPLRRENGYLSQNRNIQNNNKHTINNNQTTIQQNRRENINKRGSYTPEYNQHRMSVRPEYNNSRIANRRSENLIQNQKPEINNRRSSSERTYSPPQRSQSNFSSPQRNYSEPSRNSNNFERSSNFNSNSGACRSSNTGSSSSGSGSRR